MSSTASECDKHFFLACYSLPRVRPYIPLVVSSPIEVEVMTSPCVDWELPNPIVESPASPNEPTHTEATTTTTPPLDGADETELWLRGSDESRLVRRRHRFASRIPGQGNGQRPPSGGSVDGWTQITHPTNCELELVVGRG